MATKQIAWNTGRGNITLTYIGQGDGTITVESDANDIGTARSQIITVKTTGGIIARNVTVSQAACPFPVNTTKNFSYTGSYQEVVLPAGQYKLQCWGAQGGSNAAESYYGITAKAGGKGGYSEGILTLSTKTTVRVYVGGQGSSSTGGFNGGGSTTGSASYNSGGELGVSRMGGGGGATDIRLSDGALLSRMIVAGGGSGGAMCYQEVTTSTTTWETISVSHDNNFPYKDRWGFIIPASSFTAGETYRINSSYTIQTVQNHYGSSYTNILSGSDQFTMPSNCDEIVIYFYATSQPPFTMSVQTTITSTDTYNDYQVGYVGGGTNGGGYSSSYYGRQNGAGSGGAFGQGANQTTSNYRYCSGAGGGGWYGGGGGIYSDYSTDYCKYSGGGSGWVNTYANRGNRPSGYTGLQLDSGSTTAGSSSFPAPGGGNETGHAGNGYARITRLS